MSDSNAAPADLRVGRVLNRSFELLFGDFVKFFATTLIIWLPFLAVSVFGGFYLASVLGHPESINWFAVLAGLILVLILIFVLSLFSQAVVLFGAFQKMRDQDFSIGASLARGFSRFGMILLLGLVMGLGIFFGLVLLLVPGLIFLTMWSVALPACVIERLGPLECLTRSATLTKGHRWKVFGIYVLIIVVDEIVVQVLSRVIGEGIIGGIVNVLWLALISAYQAIAIAVIYHDLRAAKEGIGIDRIAQVFE